MKLMRITKAGRVTIPSQMRRSLGIRAGTRMLMQVDESSGQIVLSPLTRATIHRLCGKLRGATLLDTLKGEKAVECQH